MTEDKAVLSMNVDIEEAGPVYQIHFLIAGESTLMLRSQVKALISSLLG